MNMKPHKDMYRDGFRNKGYAIRIGKEVPKNSANLAYVSSTPLSPEENLLLEDKSTEINENGIPSFIQKDYLVYPNKSYLLETENGQSIFPVSTISVTDEFTIKRNRQDTPKPVFYKMELEGRFDVRGAQVINYNGGYSNQTEKDALSFEDVVPNKRHELVYLGDAIRIEANGGAIRESDKFKIQLIQEESFLYRVVVLTNFQNDEDVTYKVIYPDYNKSTQKNETKEEILKAYPYFEEVTKDQFDNIVANMEVDPDKYKDLKVYSIVENDGQYEFYATSDLMIANYQTRRPQLFKHRVEAKLQTKLNEINPGEINIGFHFIQNTGFVENISSIGKSLNESIYKPTYLEFINPHPKEYDLLKQDIRYWEVDLEMPDYHYEDYDIIFICGYGKVDLSSYREKFKHYLENGGTIYFENLGSGLTILDTVVSNRNTFIADVSFSKTRDEYGVKELREGRHGYFSRAYSIETFSDVGYKDVSPTIIFGQDESESSWKTILGHKGGGPSMIEKDMYDRGKIIVSNSGLLRSAYHNQAVNMQTVMNILLEHAENKWIFTPWRNDFVYHKDNLFLQEYKSNNADVYINDRNDYNQNQIVAKKILHPNISDYVKTFCKPYFYGATGRYIHTVNSDQVVDVNNNEFESGRIDENGSSIKEWTNSNAMAIPGWSTKKLAGSDSVFKHDDENTMFGVREVSMHISNKETGSHSFWESEKIFLPIDNYNLSVWINTKSINGITTEGVKIGVYDEKGKEIAASAPVSGSKDRLKLEFEFQNEEARFAYIRMGFIDGNGYGEVHFDNVLMTLVGNVRGVIENDGEKSLYAFSVKPNSSTVDIEAEGFGDANITRVSPVIPFTYTITPFIFKWISFGVDNSSGIEQGVYERMYGSPMTMRSSISKSDGLLNLGYLHTNLPPIPGGRDWYDKNKIFYRIELGSENEEANKLINLKLFNKHTGMEWYFDKDLVIGYKDIFWATIDPGYILHAETDFETIRATKRSFGLKLIDNQKIYPELPETKDVKENWYLRIHNGQFFKKQLEYAEWSGLNNSDDKEVLDKYKERSMKKELYKIDEYKQQLFNPSLGVMTKEDEFEYITPNTIKAPNKNLYIEKGSVEMEELVVEGHANSPNTMFRGRRKNWVRNSNFKVFIDENNNGNIVQIYEEYPYEVDFENGMILFPDKVINGKVYATYDYQNFNIYKRLYKNRKSYNDLLRNKRVDPITGETTFYSSKENWLIEPAPILKTSPGKPTKETIIPTTNYRIDYEKGLIRFNYEPQGGIYADYKYFDKRELSVRDYDIQNGIFTLSSNVSFKDDLYGKYAYYENFYEYRGYYNETLNQFIHLDLNPSVGHYSTLPQTVVVNGNEVVEYRKTPSSQLLNKMIHIYIVPASEGGNSIRHCYSDEEWKKIQAANPMYLLIAKVQVRENGTVNDVVVMDARRRGGGVTEKMSAKEVDKKIKGKQRYWDIGNWDGKAFYKNGVLIINLPKSILINHGGTLTEAYVRSSIEKHIAFGTYYILEWR